jgi:hypothetical protein
MPPKPVSQKVSSSLMPISNQGPRTKKSVFKIVNYPQNSGWKVPVLDRAHNLKSGLEQVFGRAIFGFSLYDEQPNFECLVLVWLMNGPLLEWHSKTRRIYPVLEC